MSHSLRDRYANLSEQFINAYYNNTETFNIDHSSNNIETYRNAFDQVEGFPLSREEFNAFVEYYNDNREEFLNLHPDEIATFKTLYESCPEKFQGSFLKSQINSSRESFLFHNGMYVKESKRKKGGGAKNFFKKIGRGIKKAAQAVHKKVLKPVGRVVKTIADNTIGSVQTCPGVYEQVDKKILNFPASDKIIKQKYDAERHCNTGERDCKYTPKVLEADNSKAILKYIKVKPLKDNINNPFDTGRLCLDKDTCGIKDVNGQGITDKTIFYDDSTPPLYMHVKDGVVEQIKKTDPKYIYKDYIERPKDGVKVQQIRYDFTGEFGQTISATPDKNDLVPDKKQPTLTRSKDVVMKDPRSMWLYRTEKEIRYFNNEIFNDWMYMIQTPGSLRLILKEIREMISANLGLVLLNKVDKQFGPYARGIGRNTLGLVGLPFGSPFIRIPNSFVLPYKGYMSEYVVDKEFDKVNTTYNSSLKHNNIVNALRPNTKSKTFVPNNYLDNVYQTMYKMCKSEIYNIDKEVALGLVIPNRGCQLFEAVSDKKDSVSTQRIGLSTEMASLMKVSSVRKENDELSKNMKDAKVLTDKGRTVMPRVIVTFEKPMDQMLMDAYDDVGKNMDLHVPIVNIRNKDGLIKIDINTSSTDEYNKAFVYVSKSSKSLGSYVSECPSRVNDKTKTELRLVNVRYDGNETKETPVVLMNRFR